MSPRARHSWTEWEQGGGNSLPVTSRTEMVKQWPGALKGEEVKDFLRERQDISGSRRALVCGEVRGTALIITADTSTLHRRTHAHAVLQPCGAPWSSPRHRGDRATRPPIS